MNRKNNEAIFGNKNKNKNDEDFEKNIWGRLILDTKFALKK